MEFGAKMITVGDKSIKLQIWDTVILFHNQRLANSRLSLSQGGIIDLLQVLFLCMISLIDNPSIM